MTLTLLLDLDDTLLASNMDAFIPAYFLALSESLKDFVPAEKMIKALMGGTRLMMTKKEPLLTLKHVFDGYFFPEINVDREILQLQIEKFYDQVFPNLSYLTSPIPGAVELVESAFEKGYKVIIATNPLFPAKAINHRLRWAGLAPEKYPFKIVTSYEKYHFTKENISYFPEILGKLDWPDDPVIMVGNDLTMDIHPAKVAGLPVYWVNGEKTTLPGDEDIPHGSLQNLLKMFNEFEAFVQKYSTESPPSILACLRVMPSLLEDRLGTLINPVSIEDRKEATNSLIDKLKEIIDFELRFASANNKTSESISFFIQNNDHPLDLKVDSPDPTGFLELFTKIRMINLEMIEKFIGQQHNVAPNQECDRLSLIENSQMLIVHDQTFLKMFPQAT